jgi:hypothetical protein
LAIHGILQDTMNSEELSKKAAQFRQLAERMEGLAAKRAELEKEERELASFMDLPLAPLNGHPSPSGPSRIWDYRDVLIPDGTGVLRIRRTYIVSMLNFFRKMRRADIFDELFKTGFAPADANQLSALLSQMKSEGEIAQDELGFWMPAL